MIPERKYQDGTTLEVIGRGYQMMVMEAVACLKGWRYKMAFLKNDGTPDGRRLKACWWFFEDELALPSPEPNLK